MWSEKIMDPETITTKGQGDTFKLTRVEGIVQHAQILAMSTFGNAKAVTSIARDIAGEAIGEAKVIMLGLFSYLHKSYKAQLPFSLSSVVNQALLRTIDYFLPFRWNCSLFRSSRAARESAGEKPDTVSRPSGGT